MTRLPALLAMVFAMGCSHYQPIYATGEAIEKSEVSIDSIRDQSVSGLGRILSQKLYRDFSNSTQARYMLNGELQDVSIVTSPVKPNSSSTRAYKVRAKLKLKLKDLHSAELFKTTIREEADFLLAPNNSQDQVLNTEHNRTKALHKLAQVLVDGIEVFIADTLRNAPRETSNKKGAQP